MSHAPLDWDHIRFFLALTEHRTLSATARALRVTHVTVARRIENLEHTLGVQLFERRQDGYALTRTGAGMRSDALTARTAMSAIEAIRLDHRTPHPAARVRLTCTRALADNWLMDVLARFQADHAYIAIDVIATDRNVSLANRDADLALRMARPGDDGLLVRRVVTLDFAFYATPAYLEATAPVDRRYIGYAPDATMPEARWLREAGYSDRIALAANSISGQRAAAERGIGIALLPGYVGNHSRLLARVDAPALPPPRDLWMAMLPSVARTKAARTVIDFLVASFEADANRFRAR